MSHDETPRDGLTSSGDAPISDAVSDEPTASSPGSASSPATSVPEPSRPQAPRPAAKRKPNNRQARAKKRRKDRAAAQRPPGKPFQLTLGADGKPDLKQAFQQALRGDGTGLDLVQVLENLKQSLPALAQSFAQNVGQQVQSQLETQLAESMAEHAQEHAVQETATTANLADAPVANLDDANLDETPPDAAGNLPDANLDENLPESPAKETAGDDASDGLPGDEHGALSEKSDPDPAADPPADTSMVDPPDPAAPTEPMTSAGATPSAPPPGAGGAKHLSDAQRNVISDFVRRSVSDYVESHVDAERNDEGAKVVKIDPEFVRNHGGALVGNIFRSLLESISPAINQAASALQTFAKPGAPTATKAAKPAEATAPPPPEAPQADAGDKAPPNSVLQFDVQEFIGAVSALVPKPRDGEPAQSPEPAAEPEPTAKPEPTETPGE